MVATQYDYRETILRRHEREVERWDGLVGTVVRAFERNAGAPPSLGSKVEALRNKHDTVATKVHALKRHLRTGWPQARQEVDEARRELRDAWRSVIGTLDKESLFV